MVKDNQYVILKASTSVLRDIIKFHQAEIQKNGYCWFGKIGRTLSKNIQDVILNSKTMLIFCDKKLYLCRVDEISSRTPSIGVPAYYEEYCLYPSIYFKMPQIIEIDKEELGKMFVVSSGRNVRDVISKSVLPVITAVYRGD